MTYGTPEEAFKAIGDRGTSASLRAEQQWRRWRKASEALDYQRGTFRNTGSVETAEAILHDLIEFGEAEIDILKDTVVVVKPGDKTESLQEAEIFVKHMRRALRALTDQ